MQQPVTPGTNTTKPPPSGDSSGGVDRNVTALPDDADGAGLSLPLVTSAEPSEVSMTGTLPTASDQVNSDSLDWLPSESADTRAHPVGVAVDNHRSGHSQEDRYCVSGFPALSADLAIEFLTQTIATLDADTRDNQAGSTVTSVVVTKDGNLVTAHLGDSPASAIIISAEGALKDVIQLTKDHKPAKGITFWEASDETLVQDINGRRVVEGAGGINLTHALGDKKFGAALIHQPEIQTHGIQAQLVTGDRLFVLVTSDGAHNANKGITHTTHAETIEEGLRNNLLLDRIALQIAARSKDIKDNVTVVLLEVQVGMGAVVGVFDGHGGSDTSEQACALLKKCTEEFIESSHVD